MCAASTIVSSVLLACRLEVEVVIYLSSLKNLRPDAVDAELHFQTNGAVRPDPLVRNDLVRMIYACERL